MYIYIYTCMYIYIHIYRYILYLNLMLNIYSKWPIFLWLLIKHIKSFQNLKIIFFEDQLFSLTMKDQLIHRNTRNQISEKLDIPAFTVSGAIATFIFTLAIVLLDKNLPYISRIKWNFIKEKSNGYRVFCLGDKNPPDSCTVLRYTKTTKCIPQKDFMGIWIIAQ